AAGLPSTRTRPASIHPATTVRERSGKRSATARSRRDPAAEAGGAGPRRGSAGGGGGGGGRGGHPRRVGGSLGAPPDRGGRSAMATTTPDTTVPSTTGSRWKRVAIVVAVVAAALGAGVLLFGKSVVWHTWANAAQEKDNRAAIVAEQDPGIVDVLVSTMRHPDQSPTAPSAR